MKINEFQIFKYGPIKNFSVSKLKGFNLFWGKNETGKSLIVEALVKFLVKKSGIFNLIDRVDHQPEGYLNLILDDRKELKIPEQKDKFRQLAGIEDNEYRDFFIIRNSDLELGRQKDIDQKKEEQKEIVLGVTDKLTGLKSEKINSLCNQLREQGRLTPGGGLRNVSGEKLKERYQQAVELLPKISDIFNKIKCQGLDDIDQQWMQSNIRFKDIKGKLQIIRDLKKRLQFNKGNESLTALKENLLKLEELKLISGDKEEKWLKMNYKLESMLQQKEDLQKQKQQLDDELSEVKNKFSSAEDKLNKLTLLKKKLDQELKFDILHYQDQLKDFSAKHSLFAALILIGSSSLILLIISMLGSILTRQLIFYILIMILLPICLFISIVVVNRKFKQSKLNKKLSDIIIQANRLDIKGDDLDQVNSQIEQFEQQFSQINNEYQKLEGLEEIKQKELNQLTQGKLPELEEKIWDCKTNIQQIKTTSKVDNFDEYARLVQQKHNCEELIEKNISLLDSIFQKPFNNLEENIKYWETEIVKLASYSEIYPEQSYSRNEEISCENQVIQQQQNIDELKKMINELDGDFRQIETEANQILQPSSLVCNSIEDLKAIEQQVKNFIEDIDQRRKDTLLIINILEKIDKQEREKISRLFEDESKVFKYFSEITNELYTGLSFNPDSMELQIYQGDEVFSPQQLSGGAYDQLYFSIRLAFGELLMKSKPGFFILDDPFIKSDQERLNRQFNLLLKIVEMGWQVLYFTCKSEIRQIVESRFDQNKCRSVEIIN
ncbi:MAG: ATP-binding protein [bacterium]